MMSSCTLDVPIATTVQWLLRFITADSKSCVCVPQLKTMYRKSLMFILVTVATQQHSQNTWKVPVLL